MAEAVEQRVAQSSIELHRDAKGSWSYTVKRYYDQENPDGRAAALAEIRDIVEYLAEKYP